MPISVSSCSMSRTAGQRRFYAICSAAHRRDLADLCDAAAKGRRDAWTVSRKTVEPAANAQAGASEVAFTSKMRPRSRQPSPTGKKRGLNILQEPVQMDFVRPSSPPIPMAIACACSFRRQRELQLGGPSGFRSAARLG